MLSLFAAAVALLSPPSLEAQTVARVPAPEADQGVAVDANHLYAVDNSEIAKYDRRTGAKVGDWTGDPAKFPHMNSCAVLGRELVCATSNYPATPMTSSVEVFDPVRLVHLRSIPLGHQAGSLTWVDRHDGAWWAGFANYDGRGGEPGRDHRFSSVVMFDDHWKAQATWTFPETVLARFKPYSSSGGAWGADGLLYVTGHDLPEVYVLRLPKAGTVLEHLATIKVAAEGQAIAFDRRGENLLFGISRARREIVAMKLPPVEAK